MPSLPTGTVGSLFQFIGVDAHRAGFVVDEAAQVQRSALDSYARCMVLDGTAAFETIRLCHACEAVKPGPMSGMEKRSVQLA